MTSTAPVTAGTLDVPDGTVYYEIRGSGPLLALVGAPMETAPFAPVADLLAAEYTVLTHDPRGHGKSVLNDPAKESTPELRADDLANLLTHLGLGPAVVVGSSGGAITGLALAIAHPELVQTLVAHEPPVRELLEDRVELRAVTEDVIATYSSGDLLGAVRKFFVMTGLDIPEAALQQMVGGERDTRTAESEAFFYEHEMRGTSGWIPDIAALRATPTRIIIGIGETSAGKFCDRTSRALAEALSLEPVIFPGGHGGFMETPEAFAKVTSDVLAD
ncbi:alpha/beta fold hydrolase [Nocardia jejuensis]|uniref:alpha/beta fold hydrolase n=1 Tax=Nocardia jejuensis TaxID=328049 RepID=UPI00082F5B3E|nr:alpha/beta hydrolase [Nocardia jejuensis]